MPKTIVSASALAAVLAFLPTFLLGGACSSPEKDSSAEDPRSHPDAALRPVPWTDEFTKPAVLIAAEIRVEGPRGILHHVATVSNPEELDRSEKTVPEGFLQEVTVKPGAEGAEIKAQIDRLAIVATRRLTVLERLGSVDVVLLAQGDVYWTSQASGEEKRGESLRLVGKIAR